MNSPVNEQDWKLINCFKWLLIERAHAFESLIQCNKLLRRFLCKLKYIYNIIYFLVLGNIHSCIQLRKTCQETNSNFLSIEFVNELKEKHGLYHVENFVREYLMICLLLESYETYYTWKQFFDSTDRVEYE